MTQTPKSETEELLQLDVMHAEKAMLDPLLSADPAGEVDFDQAFFDQLHDKVMASVEKTEMVAAPKVKLSRHAKALAQKGLQQWRKNSFVATAVLTAALSLLVTSTRPVSSRVAHGHQMGQNERLLREALRSPEKFNSLVTASLGQSDFFLDVAERNFDHLNLGDLDGILGSTVGTD